jgi:FkbM family methyltransferase
MKIFFKIFIYLIDLIHKNKIINFLKKKLPNKSLKIIDVGAHHGETVKLFIKNFKIEKICCYEPSKNNFLKLKKNTLSLKHKKIDIKIFNLGIGESKKIVLFNQMSESSSSTFSKINFNSQYYKKKNNILKFFFGKDYIEDSYSVELNTLKEQMTKNNLEIVDLLKIDTEGYEFEVIKGLKKKIRKVNFIYFEHHFDQMILKNYTLRDVHKYLENEGFKKILKLKMPFRKTFEYIYANKSF